MWKPLPLFYRNELSVARFDHSAWRARAFLSFSLTKRALRFYTTFYTFSPNVARICGANPPDNPLIVFLNAFLPYLVFQQMVPQTSLQALIHHGLLFLCGLCLNLVLSKICILFCIQLAKIDLFERVFGVKDLFDGLRRRNRMAIQPIVRLFKEIRMRVKEKRRFLPSAVRTTRNILYFSSHRLGFTWLKMQTLRNAHLIQVILLAAPEISLFACMDYLTCEETSVWKRIKFDREFRIPCGQTVCFGQPIVATEWTR